MSATPIQSAPPLELTFDHLLSDHLAAERLYYKSTLFWKLDKLVAVLILLFAAYSVWLVGPRWWNLLLFPLAVVEWFNALSIRPLQVIYGFKQNPKFRETYHLTLDQAGIHFRTATIDSHLKWDHFNRLLENGRLCLLIYGSRMYSVIPKRAFHSDAELSRFHLLVQQNLGVRRDSA